MMLIIRLDSEKTSIFLIHISYQLVYSRPLALFVVFRGLVARHFLVTWSLFIFKPVAKKHYFKVTLVSK